MGPFDTRPITPFLICLVAGALLAGILIGNGCNGQEPVELPPPVAEQPPSIAYPPYVPTPDPRPDDGFPFAPGLDPLAQENLRNRQEIERLKAYIQRLDAYIWEMQVGVYGIQKARAMRLRQVRAREGLGQPQQPPTLENIYTPKEQLGSEPDESDQGSLPRLRTRQEILDGMPTGDPLRNFTAEEAEAIHGWGRFENEDITVTELYEGSSS